MVLVSGEPGVGKTRLVTEVVTLAHDQGALLLWGRCAEELDVPYQPFAEALRHYAHSVPADRLRDELGPLGGETTRLIPDLDHLVPGLAEPVRTEAETERHRLFEAVADLLEAVGRTTPVVLVLDDVHWADKPSLLLLRHLLRRPPDHPAAHPGHLPRHRPRPRPPAGRRAGGPAPRGRGPAGRPAAASPPAR